MSPKIKSLFADILGVGGFVLTFFGLYQVSMSLACIVGGLGLMATAVLLEKR